MSVKSLKELLQEYGHTDTLTNREDIEQETVIDLVRAWLNANRNHWKGNNLVAESEHETIDWAVDDLLEGLE